MQVKGVFGLRRAFQTAGARSLIMSLWSVEDESTRAWMRAFYKHLFIDAMSTLDSAHHASLSILRGRRAAEESTHPFSWGRVRGDGRLEMRTRCRSYP